MALITFLSTLLAGSVMTTASPLQETQPKGSNTQFQTVNVTDGVLPQNIPVFSSLSPIPLNSTGAAGNISIALLNSLESVVNLTTLLLTSPLPAGSLTTLPLAPDNDTVLLNPTEPLPAMVAKMARSVDDPRCAPLRLLENIHNPLPIKFVMSICTRWNYVAYICDYWDDDYEPQVGDWMENCGVGKHCEMMGNPVPSVTNNPPSARAWCAPDRPGSVLREEPPKYGLHLGKMISVDPDVEFVVAWKMYFDGATGHPKTVRGTRFISTVDGSVTESGRGFYAMSNPARIGPNQGFDTIWIDDASSNLDSSTIVSSWLQIV